MLAIWLIAPHIWEQDQVESLNNQAVEMIYDLSTTST